ncbi:hypothetical protein INS49_004099 [Diaporthe citri]|uniref:uncharacterized protein n=1 Tax=Diaporthe citri TaxID=83186 RepID=UPI001C80196D|nr:uncharacterized protein INS49_004099 [Diaporthe citri]KAG6355018.1 hypothetical protein INS49_004099 [Diaporthe citri]
MIEKRPQLVDANLRLFHTSLFLGNNWGAVSDITLHLNQHFNPAAVKDGGDGIDMTNEVKPDKNFSDPRPLVLGISRASACYIGALDDEGSSRAAVIKDCWWLRLRIKASALLNWSRRHGPYNVVVLPFNKIAKLNVSVTEIAAMNFVRANTSIPVPKILEIYYDAKHKAFANIVMTKLPGKDLGDVIHDMSEAELKSVMKELSGYIKQRRRSGCALGLSGLSNRIAMLVTMIQDVS